MPQTEEVAEDNGIDDLTQALNRIRAVLDDVEKYRPGVIELVDIIQGMSDADGWRQQWPFVLRMLVLIDSDFEPSTRRTVVSPEVSVEDLPGFEDFLAELAAERAEAEGE